ncbi:ribonucleoside-diphosphate reductase small subunit [Paramecium bursaria Chlorella virus NE-JV-1]|nr:ribonucleoside-diphosphate reductase small subunit [Paramecium bursaria Chlorella virus NE-JV-1]
MSSHVESLLADNKSNKYSAFPIKHPDLFAMYKKAVSTFWTVEEVPLHQDIADWRDKLTGDERYFIKHVLGFFAGSDGIVMENIANNFSTEVTDPSARLFYAYQMFNESVHSEMYSLLLDALVEDETERNSLFEAIETIPAVGKKASWAINYLSPQKSFAERLVAWICVEGLLFSGSFCAIFWFRNRGLMPGLGLSNEFISRDEGLHQQFGELMYSKLENKLSLETVKSIVEEAVANEKEFIIDAIPCRMIGMNQELMSQYIEFIADRIFAALGYPKQYNAANPFDFMELISLEGKSNFFERRVSEYARPGVMKPEDNVFSTDGDF